MLPQGLPARIGKEARSRLGSHLSVRVLPPLANFIGQWSAGGLVRNDPRGRPARAVAFQEGPECMRQGHARGAWQQGASAQDSSDAETIQGISDAATTQGISDAATTQGIFDAKTIRIARCEI
jgi:hypothetical protein